MAPGFLKPLTHLMRVPELREVASTGKLNAKPMVGHSPPLSVLQPVFHSDFIMKALLNFKSAL